MAVHAYLSKTGLTHGECAHVDVVLLNGWDNDYQ